MSKKKYEIILVVGKILVPVLDEKGNTVTEMAQGRERVVKRPVRAGESFMSSEPLHRMEPRRYRLKGGVDEGGIDMKVLQDEADKRAEERLKALVADKDKQIAELEAKILTKTAEDKLVQEEQKLTQELAEAEAKANNEAAKKKKAALPAKTTRKKPRGE